MNANAGFDTAENEPINFHNLSSLQGFNVHRPVGSSSSGACRGLARMNANLWGNAIGAVVHTLGRTAAGLVATAMLYPCGSVNLVASPRSIE